jgi:hypothetical protein
MFVFSTKNFLFYVGARPKASSQPSQPAAQFRQSAPLAIEGLPPFYRASYVDDQKSGRLGRPPTTNLRRARSREARRRPQRDARIVFGAA